MADDRNIDVSGRVLYDQLTFHGMQQRSHWMDAPQHRADYAPSAFQYSYDTSHLPSVNHDIDNPIYHAGGHAYSAQTSPSDVQYLMNPSNTTSRLGEVGASFNASNQFAPQPAASSFTFATNDGYYVDRKDAADYGLHATEDGTSLHWDPSLRHPQYNADYIHDTGYHPDDVLSSKIAYDHPVSNYGGCNEATNTRFHGVQGFFNEHIISPEPRRSTTSPLIHHYSDSDYSSHEAQSSWDSDSIEFTPSPDHYNSQSPDFEHIEHRTSVFPPTPPPPCQHQPIAATHRSSYSELSANVAFISQMAYPKSQTASLLDTPRRPSLPTLKSKPALKSLNWYPPSDGSRPWSPPPNEARPIPDLTTLPLLKTLVMRRGNEPKKQTLACLFCRERKIACGRPAEGSADQTCNQCARRSFKCEYPTESRRGQHKRTRKKAHDVGDAD